MTLTDPKTDTLARSCTEKERAFCEEYVIDFNATDSVLRAGCFVVTTRESAASTGSDLLRRAQVKALIEVFTAQRAARTRMTADSVLHEMSLLSHSNIAHYVVDDLGNVQLTVGAPEGAMRAIKSLKRKKIVKLGKGDDDGSITYEVELTLWDKPTPLKLMGRNTGLFPDKVEITGANGKAIEVVTEVKRTIIKAGEQA